MSRFERQRRRRAFKEQWKREQEAQREFDAWMDSLDPERQLDLEELAVQAFGGDDGALEEHERLCDEWGAPA